MKTTWKFRPQVAVRRTLGILALVGLANGCVCGDPAVETDPAMDPSGDEAFDELAVTDVDEQSPFGGDTIDPNDVDDRDVEAQPLPLPTVRDVFFGYDSDVIDAEGRAALEANARILRERDDLVVLIEGHCDERGTAQYNMALGWRRAESVRDYLVRLNVPSSRIRTVSFGKERPFVVGSSEESFAQNRRAHFDLSYED